MPIKHYGIYLAYPPTIDLRAEGLGRYFAEFLKGAEALNDVRFTIVCPSWAKKPLNSLFESEQVPSCVYKIVAPKGEPYALRIFEAIRRFRGWQSQKSLFSKIAQKTARVGLRIWEWQMERAVEVHDGRGLAKFMIASAGVIILAIPFVISAFALKLITISIRFFFRFTHRIKALSIQKLHAFFAKASDILSKPYHNDWVLQLYDKMLIAELRRIQLEIDNLQDVRAWYCPTAFWPSFHNIKAPRLMCVPDVVLTDFPVGFASIGGDRFFNSFKSVEQAIRKGEYFVTYSETVKWKTLVDRYAVPASKITVVPHAPNKLNHHIDIIGYPNQDSASIIYCQNLFRDALLRSTNARYTAGIQNLNVRFIFYASQFRPNKNIISLLRAFEFLLRKRYLGLKLILTGYPEHIPEISRYVVDHRLENDVIFLHGLKSSELAACYKLAELAVNPSLSEGGCPFTFTEALSVGTPVVMSRIPVTEEILNDHKLQAVTFFDPFDWLDCAKRIEWAISHRDELLKLQQHAYAKLCERTWADVVAEHVAILDKISSIG